MSRPINNNNSNNMLGVRDTARDIILGTRPSGAMPIPPRDVVAPMIDPQVHEEMQHQLERMRRQQTELLNANENARKRLEASQLELKRRLLYAENMLSQNDVEEVRQQLHGFENKMTFLGQEFTTMKGMLDRQNADLLTMNNELKARQAAEKKVTAANQLLEQRLREVGGQLMLMKRTMDAEIADRLKTSHIQSDLINRLQDYIKQQDANKSEALATMTRKREVDKERFAEETKRLEEKLRATNNDLSKQFLEREEQIRDEFAQKFTALQTSIKSQFDAHVSYETELSRRNEERWRNQSKMIDNLRDVFALERTKYKDRFQRINFALNAIEKHMELGNDKIDKIMSAEIQSRKLHEKSLFNKVDEVETQMNNYLSGLTRSVDEVKSGVANIKVPVLDTEALRHDMELIATDKSKISMEGLLKLEERITRLQHGLNRDRRELQLKIGNSVARDVHHKLKHQIHKLDDMMDEVESAQNRIRDKVERQVPRDLNELAAKLDNLKMQITNRIDQEEEERYLAIKELQEVYGRIASDGGRTLNGIGNILPPTSLSLKREIEECKVAIKKLAESVTTVKNVLDRKVQEEIRRREQDVEVLSARVDALTIQGLQQKQQQYHNQQNGK